MFMVSNSNNVSEINNFSQFLEGDIFYQKNLLLLARGLNFSTKLLKTIFR